MRRSTVSLLVAVIVAGCSGSSEETASNVGPRKDAGVGGQGASSGAAGSDSADASDGSSCSPKTCAQLGASCGTTPDQCGGVVSCGACNDGQTCGGAGVNKCGTSSCTPQSCGKLGASCGWVSDQCGSAVDCGTCPSGQLCSSANQCSGGTGTGGAGGEAGSAGQAGDAGSAGQAGDAGASGDGGSAGSSGAGGSAPDCGAVCMGRCGSLQGCACGGCSPNESCIGNYCELDCGSICSGHCGSYGGCSCGGCGGTLVCNNGTCAACVNGDSESKSCDPGMYCPPGTSTRSCVNGQWSAWSTCSAGSTDYRYYGDGGTRCGDVVCIQVAPTGSNTTLAVTISKVNGMLFDNNTDLTLQPSSSTPEWYYCVPTQGKKSYTFNVSPADYGLSLGDTISINAWVWSPCGSSVGYQTDDAYISRCKQ